MNYHPGCWAVIERRKAEARAKTETEKRLRLLTTGSEVHRRGCNADHPDAVAEKNRLIPIYAGRAEKGLPLFGEEPK